EAASGNSGKLLERLQSVLIIPEVRGRDSGRLIETFCAVSGCDHNRALRINKRKRAQHHCVDDAEDRRVCADAKSQRENGDSAVGRTLAEHSRTKSDVLPQGVHCFSMFFQSIKGRELGPASASSQQICVPKAERRSKTSVS